MSAAGNKNVEKSTFTNLIDSHRVNPAGPIPCTFFRGRIEVLALVVFLYNGFIFYVCPVTPAPLIFLFFVCSYYIFYDINVPPSCTQKGGFSALVQQEMGKEVDIAI